MIDRLEIALWLRNNAALFAWRWKRLEHPTLHRRVVRRGDDLVIEGFPRSANTFATYAFMQANAHRNLKVGNHFHSPAQFKLARRYGVPAVLLIREPKDAVLSLMVYLPWMSAREGLRRYIAFHEPIRAITSSFVVAKFEDVTSDFDHVIDSVNRTFGTDFELFGHTSEREKALLEWIEADRNVRATDHPDLLGDAMKLPLPSREKALARAKRESEFDEPDVTKLLKRAQSIYQDLAACPVRPANSSG